jgi:hypothetical protein
MSGSCWESEQGWGGDNVKSAVGIHTFNLRMLECVFSHSGLVVCLVRYCTVALTIAARGHLIACGVKCGPYYSSTSEPRSLPAISCLLTFCRSKLT